MGALSACMSCTIAVPAAQVAGRGYLKLEILMVVGAETPTWVLWTQVLGNNS